MFGINLGDLGNTIGNVFNSPGVTQAAEGVGYALGGPIGAGIGGAASSLLGGHSASDALGSGLQGYSFGSLGEGAANFFGDGGGSGGGFGNWFGGGGSGGASSLPIGDWGPGVSDPSNTYGGGSFFDQFKDKMGGMGWGNMAKVGLGGAMIGGGLGNYGLGRQELGQRQQFMNQGQQYQQQLNNLMANPSSIQGLPGYQAGLDAVQRSMGAQGYQGSGNMASALAGYAGNAYQQQFSNLASLMNSQYGLANQPMQSPYSGLMQMGLGGLNMMQGLNFGSQGAAG